MREPTHQPPDSASYEIRLACYLTERAVERFDDLEVSYDDEGNTCLSGRFDQAALHGLLHKVRDLNLVLLSVQRTAGRHRVF